MKLAIVGSCEFANPDEVRGVIERVLELYRPALVISGGARGVDTLAADLARARGVEVDEKLPATRRWHTGFKPRNMLIAQECDRLVRIVSRRSKTYGSGWTRDYCASLGKPTEEFTVD